METVQYLLDQNFVNVHRPFEVEKNLFTNYVAGRGQRNGDTCILSRNATLMRLVGLLLLGIGGR